MYIFFLYCDGEMKLKLDNPTSDKMDISCLGKLYNIYQSTVCTRPETHYFHVFSLIDFLANLLLGTDNQSIDLYKFPK